METIKDDINIINNDSPSRVDSRDSKPEANIAKSHSQKVDNKKAKTM